MKALIYSTLLLLPFLAMCSNSHDEDEIVIEKPSVVTDTVLPNNKVIYELNLRNFSAEGTIAAVENRLDELHNLGVDIIWLMPIHPSGEKNKNGSLGSPYAVKDYKAISSNYGTLEDLKSLVAAAHLRKMEIWLDWVGNHTAWDNVWVTDHIDYYATNGSGQRPYSPFNWTDVIQLDFNNSNMRAAMIDAMCYWVKEADIDGYRCDYATGVPLSFWQEAKTAVNALKPSFTWLAEGQLPDYMGTFDFDFSWTFSDALNDFGTSKNVANLKAACQALYSNASYSNAGRLVYLTNHDLNAYSGTEFTRYGNFVMPLTVLEFTIYDLPLIYNGQEIGYNVSMGLFDYAKISWTPMPNQKMNTLIKKLTKLKRAVPALESGAGRGTLTFYDMSNPNVLCYSRTNGNSEVVVMLNLSSASKSVTFTNSSPSGSYENYLEGGTTTIDASSTITLPANGYLVFVR